ncbi:MAG: HD domain-containing protein [Candidatus Auribacterota bacterium]
MDSDMNSTCFSLLLKAICLASDIHRKERRRDKDQSPYINHPVEVSKIVAEIGAIHDPKTIIAAILHDVLESSEMNEEDLASVFGTEIASIVQEVTDDMTRPRKIRKQLQIDHAAKLSPPARAIKLADKISNVQTIFHTSDEVWPVKKQKKYLSWAQKVVEQLHGTNESMETYFTDLCRKAEDYLAQR